MRKAWKTWVAGWRRPCRPTIFSIARANPSVSQNGSVLPCFTIALSIRRFRDRIRILIEGKNISARLQDRLAVPAAAASRIQHQGPGTRRQQLDRLAHEHRAMINEFFPVLCFFLKHERASRKPNRTLKE